MSPNLLPCCKFYKWKHFPVEEGFYLFFFFLMSTLYITAVGLGKSFNKVETMCFLFHSRAKVSHSSVLSLPNLVVN